MLTGCLVAVMDEQAGQVQLPGGVALFSRIAQQLVGVIDILINAITVEIHIAEVNDGTVVTLTGCLPVPVSGNGRLGLAQQALLQDEGSVELCFGKPLLSGLEEPVKSQADIGPNADPLGIEPPEVALRLGIAL